MDVRKVLSDLRVAAAGGGSGMNMRKRGGWLVLIVGKQDFISLPQFRFSGISLRFCLQFEFGRGLEFFVTILRVCWMRNILVYYILENEKKYFERSKEFIG